MACGVLVPRPGIEPAPSAVKVWRPNHWTGREFPVCLFFNIYLFIWLCLVLVAARSSLVGACKLLVAACMWDLVP